MRPHLGQVERVEPVGLGLLERHDLHVQRPAGEVAAADRLEQVLPVVVGVLAGDPVGVLLGQELDPLVGLEVILDPELLAAGVHPHVGVARVAVHVPVGLRDPAVAHQPRHLVGGLRRQRPEVPLHVVVAQAVVGAALLAADEVLELHRVADEEDRRVVADHVVVALGRIELQREAAGVAPRVGAAALAGHGREAGEHLGLDAGLEQGRAGVGAHVLGRLEHAEGARPLGVRLALGNALAVEVGHLLDQVLVLEQDRAVGADGQRELVAGDWDCRRRLSCEVACRSSASPCPGVVELSGSRGRDPRT